MGLLKHGVIPVSPENLAMLSDRCRDPAVSVKKKALQCLGELLAVSQRTSFKEMHKTKETFSHVSALWSPGQTGVPRGAEGVAAGCDTCRDGHGDLGAGQGPGGPGPGAAQPG